MLYENIKLISNTYYYNLLFTVFSNRICDCFHRMFSQNAEIIWFSYKVNHLMGPGKVYNYFLDKVPVFVFKSVLDISCCISSNFEPSKLTSIILAIGFFSIKITNTLYFYLIYIQE